MVVWVGILVWVGGHVSKCGSAWSFVWVGMLVRVGEYVYLCGWAC